jgi:RimJ/RimL family protein N-acetyltransferase
VTPVVVHGDGIVLVPWKASDVDGGSIEDEGSSTSMSEAAATAWETGGAAFNIREPATNELLGSMGLTRLDPSRGQAEIACWVLPQSQSSATAAVSALTTWAFDNEIWRLELLAAKENSNLVRAATESGFSNEGVRRGIGSNVDGRPQDLVAFARLSNDPAGPVARALPDLPEGMLTDGVIELRPLKPSDVDDYLSLHLLPDVARYRMGQEVTRQTATIRCDRADYAWVAGEMAQCVIVDSATGAFVGDIQLINREPFTKTAMLGYSLRPDGRGKGFATRAVNLLTDWAFRIGMVRVIAGTFPENDRSRAVLLRAGFSPEATLKSSLSRPDGTRIDNIQFVRISPQLMTADG